jgi:hypothetical protein
MESLEERRDRERITRRLRNRPAHPRSVFGCVAHAVWSAGTEVFKRHAGLSARIRQASRQAGKAGRCARLRAVAVMRSLPPADGGGGVRRIGVMSHRAPEGICQDRPNFPQNHYGINRRESTWQYSQKHAHPQYRNHPRHRDRCRIPRGQRQYYSPHYRCP